MLNLNSIPSEILQKKLDHLYEKYKKVKNGQVADYIPALANVKTDVFGLSVATIDGRLIKAGDADIPFAMESLSKPFVYGVALADYGREVLMEKIGVCATGLPFDSIIDSAVRSTRLQNPLGNAGALATTSLIKGSNSEEKWRRVFNAICEYIGKSTVVNQPLYESEMATNSKNRALAHLYHSYGLFYGDVDDTISRYTKACSLMVTAADLAIMGVTLANKGINSITGRSVIEEKHVRDILSVMLIYGLYDESGHWIFDVGLPGKSGVGGGILAVIPGKGSISTYSPLLNESGNSIRGLKTIIELGKEWDLHLLG